jgi:UDP-N-acetylglucosamine diphosphorylase/glucosamine-1-phosphate N-acetyltransferase
MPSINELKIVDLPSLIIIDRVWKIFQQNGKQIRSDFNLITNSRISRGIQDEHTRCYNVQNVFVEEGVTIRAAILNAENGPIYLGKNSHVHEGAIIRGPFAMGEGSHVNMGAKVRGDTSLGPFCKIGGEVSNSVIFGYSNKAHDGFLGNSVIGEWCNVGADTNTSNLKNNFQNVKLWSYMNKSQVDSGLQFCGLMMGDHGKCGINTMFNTGTVTGVCANIFGEGYPKKFIPSFTWGGANESDTYNLEKALEAIGKGMERRNKSLNDIDKNIMKEVFAQTAQYRTWENESK